MEALEAIMKKHNIFLDTFSTESYGHELSTSTYSFIASSSSSSNECPIVSRAS